MSRIHTVALLIVVGCFLVEPVHADDRLDQQINGLETLKKQFLDSKEVAKQKVLSQFDDTIKRVTNSSQLKATDRLTLADKLRSERQVFVDSETLPENTEMLQAGWQFATTLARKYDPLSKGYERAISGCIKQGQMDRAATLKSDKESFDDKELPGRRQFATGANWHGSRHDAGGATTFRFQVTELQGGLFKARVEQNTQVAGHPTFDVSGSLDGLRVQCRSLTRVQGSVQLARCEGILVGNTLILEIVAIQKKGPATASLAVLRR